MALSIPPPVPCHGSPPRIVTQFGSMTENADLKCSWNNQESWTGPPGYLRHRGENLLSKIAWLNVSFVTVSFPRTSSVIISFDCFSEPSKNQSQLHHWLTFSTAAVHSSVSHQFESLQNLTAEKDFPVGDLLRHVDRFHASLLSYCPSLLDGSFNPPVKVCHPQCCSHSWQVLTPPESLAWTLSWSVPISACLFNTFTLVSHRYPEPLWAKAELIFFLNHSSLWMTSLFSWV